MMNVPQNRTQIQNAIWALPSVDIAHGAIERLRNRPDYTFRPYRFVVDPICAPFYIIREMMFGHQIMIDNPVSAVCFPSMPPDYQTLSEHERRIIDECLNKITYPTIGPYQAVSMAIQHRGMCPWHSDCNSVQGMEQTCKAPPFSSYFQGVSQY